jgi:cell division protein FtsX
LSIPLVNLIVLLVWAFDNSTNTIKANFAKAALIWVGIFLVLYLLLIVVLIGSYVP